MPKHEISNVRTRGTGAIEKLISEVVKKAAEEIGKIVEEW